MEGNKIQTFDSAQFGRLRTLEIDGDPWFVGRDVAAALGYAKPENALIAHVDADDKTTTLIQSSGSNYKSNTTIINESGLYSLIMSSKLPSAKQFKRWVTSEVLPSIRKTGGYSNPNAAQPAAESSRPKFLIQSAEEMMAEARICDSRGKSMADIVPHRH